MWVLGLPAAALLMPSGGSSGTVLNTSSPSGRNFIQAGIADQDGLIPTRLTGNLENRNGAVMLSLCGRWQDPCRIEL